MLFHLLKFYILVTEYDCMFIINSLMIPEFFSSDIL